MHGTVNIKEWSKALTEVGLNSIFLRPYSTPPHPPVGQGHRIIEASRSHSDTPQSLGLLWTSDQPDAETSDSTQHSRETDTLSSGGIRTRNPMQRMAANPSLRPRGHWDRQRCAVVNSKYKYVINIFTRNKKHSTECLS